MKTLYLLRHAKAESAGPTVDDIDRRLAPRGREACGTVGQYIKSKKYIPSFILCSPAKRTRETFELVMQSAGVAPQHQFERSLYLTSAEKIIGYLLDMGDNIDSLMVIGHNPSMHHLALTLAQPTSSELHRELELKYPTGALTVLRFPVDSWSDIASGAGELIDFMVPAN